jgi:hypothetical protein
MREGCDITRARPTRARGFTLIEAAIATGIVGSGIVAVMAAQRAFHQRNEWATHAAIAQQLGCEIRELALRLPARDPVTGDDVWGAEPDEASVDEFDDLDDLDGAVFDSADGTGPISALRTPIPDMAGWRQRVRVEYIDPFELTSDVDPGESGLVRVTVAIDFQPMGAAAPAEFTRVSWIAPRSR